ncbi:MAG TPA: TetR/AcrR family transcriptional regulator [Tepidisphaeraceae bacterium]|nr:TetR/AcrR family transcriptional regulator [Tepidisphaeraceae bacterium]
MREAMEAFWEHGYHGTSVSDLLSEMKLNRGSLYGTFGDKKKLFMAALTEYGKQGREIERQVLEDAGSAREAIRQWIDHAALMCTGDPGLKGCLGLKAAVEMAPHDKDVADWVKTMTHERELLLAKVIRRGQAAGEFTSDLEPRAAARYLITAVAGLKLLGTASPSERDVREVVALVLRILD